jgi:hypothetical protein
MSLRILGVHGIGNNKPKLTEDKATENLSTEWVDALRPRLADVADVDLRVAYYAPHLNKETHQGIGDGLDDVPAEASEWLASWLTELGAAPTDIPQAAWAIPVRVLVDKIAESAKLNAALVRPFVGAFLREVDAYLRRPDSDARHGARAVVEDAIRDFRPHVVVGHSLGSVVAYEALCNTPGRSIGLLLTMGSPLGLPGVVFDRLQPSPVDNRGTRPECVARWVNVADPGDVVAVPRPFTKRFSPDADWADCHIHWGDFHTALRYLASPRVVDTISAFARNGSRD